MRRYGIYYANDEVLEKIHEARILGNRRRLHTRHAVEVEVPLSRCADYEARIESGFRIFEMAEKGYPYD